MNDELKITDHVFVQNDHGLYFQFTSNLKNTVVIMQHVTCAWKHVHIPTYCTIDYIYVYIYIYIYRLYTAYKSVQDTYVNGQVGISIKLSDMYCFI